MQFDICNYLNIIHYWFWIRFELIMVKLMRDIMVLVLALIMKYLQEDN